MKLKIRTIIRAIRLLVCLCGAALACGAMIWLTGWVRKTPPADQKRADERLKILADVNTSSSQILENYAWQDTDKGFVRLPIERAKELTIEEWKNPAAARAKLMARAAVLLAVPPPPPQTEELPKR